MEEPRDSPTDPVTFGIKPQTVDAKAVTNFQILPENGGYILMLGTRQLKLSDTQSAPSPVTDIFAAAFLSHAMIADLARVLNTVVSDFEKAYGRIPMPGVDKTK